MDRGDRFDRSRVGTSKKEREEEAARLTHELATKPPTKDVASIKAASDVYEANLEGAKEREDRSHRQARDR